MRRTLGLAILALFFVSMIGNACAEDTTAIVPEIKTTTVGGVMKLAWPFLGGKVNVASRDAPKMAERLAASFAKSGYKVVDKPGKLIDSFQIIRDYRGKAADYVPQTSDTGSGGGGWGGALFSLGISVLIGHQMDVISTSNLLQSNANAVAETVRLASDAYGNPTENAEMASAAEKAREETNLVVYRLCFAGSCAHALSAGASDLERLDEACFKDGILKLAHQDAE